MKVKFFAVALLAFTPLFAGTTLYTQALVNSGDGGPFSNDPNQIMADLFSLAEGGNINQAVWFGASLLGTPFSDFNIEFYADDGGSPGVQLAKFTGTPTIVDQGVLDPDSVELLQFTMNFAGFTAFPGVHYFFSVSDSTHENFLWANSNLSSGAFFSSSGAGGPWNPSVSDGRESQAFSLIGTTTDAPEPGSGWLTLGAASVLAAGLAWRRVR